MAKDYYETLGVGRDASREEIKRAYKALAKQHHPDINKGPEAERTFKEINEAAAVLGDDEKRRQYDGLGHDAFTQGASGGAPGFDFSGFDSSGFRAGSDFGDIFEHLNEMFGLGGGTRRSRRGADLRFDLSLSLEEAASGVKKRITLRRQGVCTSCQGAGGTDIRECSTCRGSGMVRQARRTPFGYFQSTGACPTCDGQGKSIGHPCSSCDGTGRQVERKELEVEIPAGVDDGTRLRVNGEGEAGPRGSRPGDLYVFIGVETHRLFERDGNDIHLTLPISIFQAVFGAEVTVPTLASKAKLKIPSGTQSGTIFRLKERGVSHLHRRGAGDQFVKVQVVTPTKLSKKQEKLFRDLAKEYGDEGALQKGLLEKLKEKLR